MSTIKSIEHDGQPTEDGLYNVFYREDEYPSRVREFRDGRWYLAKDSTCQCAFGNWTLTGERYQKTW